MDRAGNRWRPRVPRLVAWVVRIAAVIAVVDILEPHQRPHVASRTMDAAVHGVVFAAAMCAAGVMLVLAAGLRRRKRRAWRLTLSAAALGGLGHLAAQRWTVVAVNAAVIALLVWTRADFTARSERTARWTALRVLLVMGTFSVATGLMITMRAAPSSGWSARLGEVFVGLVGFTPELQFGRELGSQFTTVALNSMGALTALLTVAAFLAPARKPARLSPEAERRLRDLLTRYGARDSLGYFALRGDKVAVFAAGGKAAVVYRVVGGVTLASGDPIGDPEAWPQAITAWLDEADVYAWTPGVIGASEQAAIAYRRAGLDSYELGDEAVLEAATFTTDGRAMRGVRQAVNRVRRSGHVVDVSRQRDLDAAALAEITRSAAHWRGDEAERGFSMALGRIGDSRDGDLVLVRVREATGRLVCVLGFVPWGADGLSLDLMRREPAGENGTVELAVTSLMSAAASLRVQRVSLNFAVFRAVFDRGSRVGAGPVLRLWHKVLVMASRWWQLESLYRANAKFCPQWRPRFVCFRRVAELPRVGLAALEAEAFVRRPRWAWMGR